MKHTSQVDHTQALKPIVVQYQWPHMKDKATSTRNEIYLDI